VTCVASAGGAEWWMTRESGELPGACNREGCWSCEWSDIGVVPPTSYLVVAFSKPGELVETCIAPLCRASVASLLYGGLRIWYDEWRRPQSAAMLTRILSAGGCRRCSGCACCLGSGVCRVCSAWSASSTPWIHRNGYTGLFPCPVREWFTGVTDALDVPSLTVLRGMKWLCCPAALD
jgi:hypothetical protein